MKFTWTLPALALSLCASVVHADDEAEMKALLAKAITAHGGADNLKKYTGSTMRGTGKVAVMGQMLEFTTTASYQEPDKVRSEVEFEFAGKKYTILQVVNGDKGWYVFDGKTTEFTKEQQEQIQESLDRSRISRLTPLLDKAYTLSPLGEIKVDAKAAVGIRAERKDFAGANLYFDKQGGMLVKSEMQMTHPGDPTQKINGETFYSDYRKIEGLMVPHKIVVKSDGKTILEIDFSEVTLATKLDDNLFAKP
jgi:outer membrane lipoprotein-sorting protein